jgi:very-short-patch-repair endonuclease
MSWERSPKRNEESIDVARSQRAMANSFARTLWQVLRKRRCRGMSSDESTLYLPTRLISVASR